MRCEQAVKDIYKIAGVLEALSVLPGETITITPGLAADLEDAVDKLELIGAELNNMHIERCLYDLIGQMKASEASTNEETEESPPNQPAADQ